MWVGNCGNPSKLLDRTFTFERHCFPEEAEALAGTETGLEAGQGGDTEECAGRP
jgi:hypothetical protein